MVVAKDSIEFPRLSAEVRQRYESRGDWTGETLLDTFENSPSGVATREIVGPDRTCTHSDILKESKSITAALQGLGIEKGDSVAYQLPNRVSTAVIHLAILQVGAVAVPITPIYRDRAVRHILNDANCNCLFVPSTYRNHDYPEMISRIAPDLSSLREVVIVGDNNGKTIAGIDQSRYDELRLVPPTKYSRPLLSGNDLCMIPYTSGTTTDPKGVAYTHNTLMCYKRNVGKFLNLFEETHTVFNPSPVTHVAGSLWGIEMPFYLGFDVVYMNAWNAETAVELIDRHDCTMSSGATPFLRGIVEEAPTEWDCPLELFRVGGASIPPNLVRRATERLDCTVQRVYGSTECPSTTLPSVHAPLEKLAETDGRPAPWVDLKLVDIEAGEKVSTGKKGEVWVKSPHMTIGYLKESLNEKAFENGWLKTGDLGVLDDDGYLEIVGRKKDIIVRGGENIPVKQVEDRIDEHPAVEDVAVVAMPDPELQEKVCAYVKTKPERDFEFEDLRSRLENFQIAKQKYPERLECIESFPRTASGKIQKKSLRKDIADKLGREPVNR
jgi:cyclohexanecarboxylate-CoA ligase